MNIVQLTGGITRDPSNRADYVSFTIAVNGTRYDSDSKEQVVTTMFVTCQAFGEVAHQILNSGGLNRGDEIYVLGELAQVKKEAGGDPVPSTRVNVVQWSLVRAGRVRAAQEQQWPTASAPSAGEPPW